MNQTAIAVEGLVKRYDGRAVVDGVSMEVQPGEIVALLGPNGAGKTTTVEIVEGYRQGDAGTVRVLGVDPMRGGRDLRARVGLMLQVGGFDMRARPRETLVQYGRFHADPRDPDELLGLCGLPEVATARYRRLSGGERQRLGLAVALVGRPEVVILDEPTAGMDPEGRAATRAILTGLRDEGVAVLLTSHDLTEVERLADRIVVLVAGRVAAATSPGALAAELVPRLRVRLDPPLNDAARERLRVAVGATRISSEADHLIIDGVTPDPANIAALATWCADAGRLIVDLRSAGGTLEEAYLALVERATAAGVGVGKGTDR